MKLKLQLKLILFFATISTFLSYSQTVPAWLYFGQTPPGDTAVIFAPGTISLTNRNEVKIAFSQDGNEVYVDGNYYKRENNTWTGPVKLPFTEDFGDPVLSVDGNKLFLTACNSDYSICGIWMAERTLGGWSEPQHLPAPINSGKIDMGYTETADSVIYIGSNRVGSWGVWCIRRLSDSLKAEKLDPVVNSPTAAEPCVSPDGSYLIFNSTRNDTYGIGDLYVTFNKGTKGWTVPINMNNGGAKINIAQYDHQKPSLSPDGKFLFFNRDNLSGSDIYWVSTHVLTGLKKAAYAPKLSRQIPNMNVKIDSVINYVVPAGTFSCEYDIDSLKFTATLNNSSALPSWLNFNPAIRTLSGTPKQTEIDSIKITVTNPDRVSISCTFKIIVTNVTGIQNNYHFLRECMLFQNYPNPFNPSTLISYLLSSDSKVELIIYDALGQKVKTLVDTYLNAGSHSVTWNGTDDSNNPVSSGVYYYRLNAGEHSFQKKMILLR